MVFEGKNCWHNKITILKIITQLLLKEPQYVQKTSISLYI
jgi:hypothetical protein